MRVRRGSAASPVQSADSYKQRFNLERLKFVRFAPFPPCGPGMNHGRHHPGNSLLTRPSLLFRVREWNDSTSWEEFHRLYRRLIYGRARRAGLSHADAEDVAQDVFKRVAETIRDFDTNPERGSFRGWLMKLTLWRIADKFKSRREFPPPQSGAHEPPNVQAVMVDNIPAPAAEEDEWDREWQQHLLAAATERIARQVKPLHFQVFDLYVLQQWPLLRVTKELRVSPASVYVISHRLKNRLKDEVVRLQKQLE
jgi:RNA polymerase sigma factor (sigma-70 family)